MEPNQNPPSEREWTPEEMEDFFSDKFIDAYNSNVNAMITNGPVTATSEEITLEKLIKMYEELERLAAPKGIFITHLVPPESGWMLAMYCPICKETTFRLDKYACKPSEGDYFLMKQTCGSDEHWQEHNIQLNLPLSLKWGTNG